MITAPITGLLYHFTQLFVVQRPTSPIPVYALQYERRLTDSVLDRSHFCRGAKLVTQQSTAEVLYMLRQLPPRAEATLTCNYEPRVEKVCAGQVSQALNRVASSKCLRVSSL